MVVNGVEIDLKSVYNRVDATRLLGVEEKAQYSMNVNGKYVGFFNNTIDVLGSKCKYEGSYVEIGYSSYEQNKAINIKDSERVTIYGNRFKNIDIDNCNLVELYMNFAHKVIYRYALCSDDYCIKINNNKGYGEYFITVYSETKKPINLIVETVKGNSKVSREFCVHEDMLVDANWNSMIKYIILDIVIIKGDILCYMNYNSGMKGFDRKLDTINIEDYIDEHVKRGRVKEPEERYSHTQVFTKSGFETVSLEVMGYD